MEAVGAYLGRLREAKRWSRVKAAKLLDTNDVQLGRIEKGEIDTRSSFLFAFLDLVEGDANQLHTLMRDTNAKAAQGTEAAEAWLSQQKRKMQTASEETKQRSVYVFRRMAELLEAGHSHLSALRIVESELSPGTPDDA